jgi:hypothetical protein
MVHFKAAQPCAHVSGKVAARDVQRTSVRHFTWHSDTTLFVHIVA